MLYQNTALIYEIPYLKILKVVQTCQYIREAKWKDFLRQCSILHSTYVLSNLDFVTPFGLGKTMIKSKSKSLYEANSQIGALTM